MADSATALPLVNTLPPPLQAWFEGQAKVLVASFCENERPLRGWAGWVDWQFEGAISRALKAGHIQGTPGECVYFPLTRAGRTYSVILVGAGKIPVHGRRPELPMESRRALKKNLHSMGLSPALLSRADLGGLSESALQSTLRSETKNEPSGPGAITGTITGANKGVELWIVP